MVPHDTSTYHRNSHSSTILRVKHCNFGSFMSGAYNHISCTMRAYSNHGLIKVLSVSEAASATGGRKKNLLKFVFSY